MGEIIADTFRCVYCLGTGVVASSRVYKAKVILASLLAWLFVVVFYDLHTRSLAPDHPVVEFLESLRWVPLILAAYHVVGLVRPKRRE